MLQDDFLTLSGNRIFVWEPSHIQYKELSAASTSYTVVSDATRGEILDVNGKALAVNETAYNVVLNKVYLREDELNGIIINLINILNECDKKYYDALPVVVHLGRDDP